MTTCRRPVSCGVTLAVLSASLCLAAPAASAVEFPVLHLAKAQGDEPVRLVQLDEEPGVESQGSGDWSADGTRIAFDSYRKGRGETLQNAHVYVVNANGAEPRDLGPGLMPSWSPDGKRIAFSSYQPYGVQVMDADGSNRETIDGSGWCGRWSPDGRMIAYTVRSGGRGDFCLYDVETKQKRFVFAGSENPYEMVYWSFCWSPDSERLCFLGVREKDRREIATVSVGGPSQHLVVHRRGSASAAFAWHPDGSRILFAMRTPLHAGNRLFSLPADRPAEPTPLFGLPAEFVATACDWSPDGSSLLFTGYASAGGPPAPPTP